MICLQDEHIKRFGLTKAAILAVMIPLQKQAFESGEEWFRCSMEELGDAINLNRSNVHVHVHALIKVKALVKKASISTDRRVFYKLQI